ncbi:MAG: hypothetical protein AABX94_01065, partial [Nanoarchaeota archaeon]
KRKVSKNESGQRGWHVLLFIGLILVVISLTFRFNQTLIKWFVGIGGMILLLYEIRLIVYGKS